MLRSAPKSATTTASATRSISKGAILRTKPISPAPASSTARHPASRCSSRAADVRAMPAGARDGDHEATHSSGTLQTNERNRTTKLTWQGLAGLALGMTPVAASAHITLAKAQATVGASYKATFRVPRGCDGAA